MNLVLDPWLPIRRHSGREERIAPWQVTESLGEDPVVGFASPRPDFDGAQAQLLIGLLQYAMPPCRAREWRAHLEAPPAPEVLRAKLGLLAYAFELFGDGPRFLQDLELETDEAERQPIERLFIESTLPGKDHFVRAGQITALCPDCAASALLTLQLNAPSGGRGHRTSVRGGGPLTTLVLDSANLWSTLWQNVLEASQLPRGNPEREGPADIFPWLAPTRTSEGGRPTTADDAHPLQVYWGMPRRIRLMPDAPIPAGERPADCSLCARPARPAVREYVTKNLGVNYDSSWIHPLSPYRQDATGMSLPFHGDADGLSYRHWLGLVQSHQDSTGKRLGPALVVAAAEARSDPREHAGLRLWAFGYAMDNMKALAWCDGTIPLVLVAPERQEDYERATERLVLAARQVERSLAFAVKQALSRPGDLKTEPAEVDLRFWQETEAPFFERLRPLGAALAAGEDAAPIRAWWLGFLSRTANRIFQEVSGSGHFEAADPRRVALAWRGLQKVLHGPKLRELLDLPAPPPRQPPPKSPASPPSPSTGDAP